MAKALTVKGIEAIEPGTSRKEVPDGGLPGLYFIVQPSGATSWAVRFRVHGAVKPNRKLTIGAYPAFSLKEARKAAGVAIRAAAEGKDPSAERKLAKAPKANDDADKVETVFEQYLARHVRPNNRQSTITEAERLVKAEVLKAWAGKRIQDIGRRDVRDLLDAAVDRGSPYIANRLHSLLTTAFSWFLERDIISTTPVANISKPAAEEARDRVLTDAEIKLMWKAGNAQGWPFGPLAQLLLLTGQRRDEVAAASWSEFELDGKEPTWTIPKERAKNGKAHAVALAPQAVAILQALPRVKDKGGAERLTFTTTGDTPISGYSRGKAALDAQMLAIAKQEAAERGDDPDRAKVEPWRFHDLRRSAASGMARLGFPPHVVEKVLNHRSGTIQGVAAVYNRFDYAAERRTALVAWADYLDALISDRPAANVVPLRAAQ